MPLSVTNNNNFTYKDRYDGVDYVFPPKVQVIVEEAAAKHIFAYGGNEQDRVKAMARNGWLQQMVKEGKGGMDDALAIYHRFVFREVEPEWKEVRGEVKHMAQPDTSITVRSTG